MAEQSPPQWRDKIFHATLGWSNYSSRGGDALPEQYQKPQGISLLLHVDTEAEADAIFGALSETGAVQVPIQFWTARFGMVVDQFGIPWLINGGELA